MAGIREGLSLSQKHRRDPKRVALAVLIAATLYCFPEPAEAGGAHEGGTFIVHGAAGMAYTTGVNFMDRFDLDRCEDAVRSFPASDWTRVWWVVAAFPPSSSPLLAGVAFGIAYPNDGLLIEDAGTFSSVGLEIPEPGWPLPYSGTSIIFDDVKTDRLVPVYWFAGYQYGEAEAEFRVIEGAQGAVFLEPTIPGTVDEAAALGSIVIGGSDGRDACPEGSVTFGTCCIETQWGCECRVLTETACRTEGGVWEAGGDCTVKSCDCEEQACCFPNGRCRLYEPERCLEAGGIVLDEFCLPNPCEVPGACCEPEEGCLLVTSSECEAMGGDFRGENTSCESVDCQEPCVYIPAPPGQSLQNVSNANAGGTLIIHHDPDIELTRGPLAYCSAVADDAAAGVTTRVDVEGSAIFFVLAAFPEDSQPDLTGLEFGIYYPNCIEVLDSGSCANIEAEFADWPNSGTGVAMIWASPQTDHLVPIQWFEAEIEENQTGTFELGPQPDGDGYFLDSFGRTVAIEDFGSIGFHTDGYYARPKSLAAGACCIEEQCEVLERVDCESQGGIYRGAGSVCDAEICDLVPVVRSSWGQIKNQFRGTEAGRSSGEERD